MTEPAARWTHVELCHAEALWDECRRRKPAVTIFPTAADTARELAWLAENTRCALDARAELARIRHLLCHKCSGDGQSSYTHRHRGVCYSCQGDGYSAAGRKAAGLPRRERRAFN